MKTFSEIFAENRTRLIAFIRKRVDSEADAADIMQDVFMRLFMQDDISLIENVGSWLFRTAGNRITDVSRKRHEERMPMAWFQAEDDEFLEEMSCLLVDEDASAETELIRSLVWRELAAALNELPKEQRLAFVKTELEGIPFKELSQQTGVPVNTLLSRKHYAVRHLRKRLEDVYDDILGLL